MTGVLGHTFVSGKPTNADPTEVQGARDWDGAGYTSGSHGFTGGNVGAVLVRVANDVDGSGGSSWVQSVATGSVFLSGGVAALPTWGKVDLTAHVTNTLPAANGGTGLAAYAVGDLLYASAVTPTLSRLAAVAVGQVLVSAGVNTPPAWSASPSLTSATFTGGNVLIATGGTALRFTDSNAQIYRGTNDIVIQAALGSVIHGVDNAGSLGSSPFRWATGYFGTALVVGTNPANGGAVRLANAGAINGRSANNSADYNVAMVDASNQIILGDGNAGLCRINSPGLRLAGFQIDGITNLVLQGTALVTRDTGDLTISTTTGGNVVLSPAGDIKWGKPLVALGAGGSATLGTIGGSGPATATQNTWMRVLDSSGAAFFVPAFK